MALALALALALTLTLTLQEDFIEGAEAGRAESSLGGKGDSGGWPASDLGSAVNAEDAEAGSLLQGWVLLDGTGLGLSR